MREHPAEIVVRRGLVLMTVAFLLCYAYLAGASVFHAVVQRSAGTQAEHVKTTLAGLEREYFVLSKSVDPSLGSSIGLSRAASKSFVERAVLVGLNAN